MKKKILAWCAAIAIIALVSAAFLRPADENPDFGGVAPLYTLSGSVGITDGIGDTDVVRATSYTLSSIGSFENCTVWFETDRDLARTSRHYVNGSLIDDGGVEYEAGMIEQLIDGEWVVVDGFGSGLYSTQLSPGAPHYGVLSKEFGIVDFSLDNAFNPEPGLYRITHYFRENVSRELYDYETGEELYTVTHTVEVPEPSGKVCDLYGVMLWEYSPYSDESENYRRVVINFNHGERDIYMDRARMTLARREGFRWVEAEDASEDTPAILRTVPEDAPADDRYDEFDRAYIYPYIDDVNALYRLTLEFVENADGSGERYTLTLNLRFS